MSGRLVASYRVRSDARAIEARARDIAVEQSVEMPLSAMREASILCATSSARWPAIEDRGDGRFDVASRLPPSTVGADAGQLLNMLFGNTSLHDDVVLHDVALAGRAARGVRRPCARPRRAAPAGGRDAIAP